MGHVTRRHPNTLAPVNTALLDDEGLQPRNEGVAGSSPAVGLRTDSRNGIGSAAMETINGCTVVPPSDAPEPVTFGPAETQDAYVVIAGAFPPGQPAPPLHVHPETDEAFYVADGDATFQLGDREVRATAGCLVFVPRGLAHTV